MSTRIVFMGTPDFAVPCLSALHGEHHVVATVSRPDKRRGRGLQLQSSAVKRESERLGIPCLTPPKVSTPEFCSQLRELKPDYLIVAAFGEILKSPVLESPRVAPINVHASLLPRLRGAAPVNWAIIRGEPVTGITTFVMDKGMDTGDILVQSEVPILPRETAGELTARLSSLAPEVLLRTLQAMEASTLTPIPQADTRATYAPRLRKADGAIDWDTPADELDRFIRGVSPWPSAQTSFRGKRARILQAAPARCESADADPGMVRQACQDRLVVAAGGGTAILIQMIQPEGRRAMDARSFIAGYRPVAGDRFGT